MSLLLGLCMYCIGTWTDWDISDILSLVQRGAFDSGQVWKMAFSTWPVATMRVPFKALMYIMPRDV